MEHYDLMRETGNWRRKRDIYEWKKYLYSINKSENKEEVLVIKFYNPNNKSDIYLFYLWSS